MTQYSKLNVIYRLQKWLDSVPGQTFLNYAYSWGASIVILGTLFKLTHIPGANIMLFIGMGTEVCVFFISAFDRPFDKTADGRDIPVHVNEEVLEQGERPSGKVRSASPIKVTTDTSGNSGKVSVTEPAFARPTSHVENPIQPVTQTVEASQIVQQQENTPEMAEAQGNYVTELNKLTEMLGKVSEQSERLTRDSEEMENLNRTLTGISKVYEMQLKSASQQVGTIDQINDQSKLMARQIEQLNKIYARMIEAMTVNMRASSAGVTPKTDD